MKSTVYMLGEKIADLGTQRNPLLGSRGDPLPKSTNLKGYGAYVSGRAVGLDKLEGGPIATGAGGRVDISASKALRVPVPPKKPGFLRSIRNGLKVDKSAPGPTMLRAGRRSLDKLFKKDNAKGAAYRLGEKVAAGAQPWARLTGSKGGPVPAGTDLGGYQQYTQGRDMGLNALERVKAPVVTTPAGDVDLSTSLDAYAATNTPVGRLSRAPKNPPTRPHNALGSAMLPARMAFDQLPSRKRRPALNAETTNPLDMLGQGLGIAAAKLRP